MKNSSDDILAFWFDEIQPQQWFQVNADFDATIKERFEGMYHAARDGLCEDWGNSPEGTLALCIILDQFPRNMYRGTPEAFATDKQALLIAKKALSKGFDQVLSPAKRRFLYLPYEHSENINDQHKCVELFEAMKDDDPLGYEYAVKHLKVIEQYNRFPHRNSILGRDNTPEEETYLAQPGAGF